jgi:hypothetical protein
MLKLLTTGHATDIRFSICAAQHLRSAASAVVFGFVAPDSWRWRGPGVAGPCRNRADAALGETTPPRPTQCGTRNRQWAILGSNQ